MPDAYQTLAELQEAHDALMQQLDRLQGEGAQAPLAALFPEVRLLLQRGAASGACLLEVRERRAAQAMLDYWASQCYAASLDVQRPTLVAHNPALLPRLDDAQCPFVGLEAFGELQSRYFHGREDWVKELVRRLASERLVVVTGASGSGKSSLVLAGLLPALRAGAVPGSEAWIYAPPVVPGPTPLDQLLEGLQGIAPLSSVQQLRDDPESLARELATLPQPLVLVIDQFEELLTLRTADNAHDFDAYARCLAALIEQTGPGHRLVMTMRSDVETRLAREYPDLNQRYGKAAFPLSAMDAAQLRECIERPAAQGGLKFQDGVVDELVRSVVGEDAGLPLLQFTLMALWERRQGNLITREAQRAVGNPRQAMAAAAEALFLELSDEQRQAAQRIFLALGRLDPNVQSASVYRNRAARRLLQSLSEPHLVDAVIAKFERLRLLRVSRAEGGDDPLEDRIEVAHEALLRNWERLQRWFAERRDERQRRAFLHQQAIAWRSGGFDDAFLLTGLALKQAEEELAREPMDAIDQEFVTRGRLHEDGVLAAAAIQAAEREQQLRERAEFADWRAAQTEALALRQKRAYGWMVLVALLAFVAIWGWAQFKLQRAEHKLVAAETERSQAEQERQAALRASEVLRRKTQEWVDQTQEEVEALRDKAAADQDAARRLLEQQRIKLAETSGERDLIRAEQLVERDADDSLFFVNEALRANPKLLRSSAPVLMQVLLTRRPAIAIPGKEFGEVEALAMAPGGQRLLFGDSIKLQEWAIEGGKARRLHETAWGEREAGDTLHQALYLADGRAVLAAERGLWWWQDGRLSALDEQVQARRLRRSDDGRWLGALEEGGRRLFLYDLQAGGAPRVIDLGGEGDGRPALDLLFLPRRGALVVLPRQSSSGGRELLRLFDRQGEGFAARARSVELPECAQGQLPSAGGGSLLGRALSPRLCLHALRDDAPQPVALRQLPTDGRVDQLVFGSDGRHVVRLTEGRNEALVVDLQEGSSMRLQGPFEASQDWSALLAIDGAGRRLAIYGASDDSVRVYELGGGAGGLAESGRVLYVSDDERVAVVRSAAPSGDGLRYQARSPQDGRLLRELDGGGRFEQLDAFSVSAGAQGGPWLHAQARCHGDAEPQTCLVSHDLSRPDAPPHVMAFGAVLRQQGDLFLLQQRQEWWAYRADLGKVVWRMPTPPPLRNPRDPRTARLLVGDARHFLVQRPEGALVVAELFALADDGGVRLRARLTHPAAQAPRWDFRGSGRVLWRSARDGSALWDLRTQDALAEPLWRDAQDWRTVLVNPQSGRVALRLPAGSGAAPDWVLRRLDEPAWRGRLSADHDIDARARIAWTSSQGAGWQLRDLCEPERVRLQGPGRASLMQLNAQGNVLAVARESAGRAAYFEYPSGQPLLISRLIGNRPLPVTGAGGYLFLEREGMLQPARAERLLEEARKEASRRRDEAEQRCRLLESCPTSSRLR